MQQPAPQPYGYPQSPASAAQRPPVRQPQRAPLRPLAKPGRTAPRPAPRQERNPRVTEFVLHQFPLGYIPVAASQPNQQLAEAPPHRGGTCFPPQDHPEARLVTDGDALQRFRCGQAQQAHQDRSSGTPEPIPAELTENHRRHGEHSELAWEHTFVRRDGEHLGYVWPDPGDCPEGGREPGQPVVLQPDTVLDRLGDGEGRLLFASRTPFPRRSQPPEFADRAYRRYRVMRPLPVWETVTAGWFGQPGGGTRYRTTYPIDDLVALGHLVELTPELVAAEADTQRLDVAAGQATPTADSAAEETQS